MNRFTTEWYTCQHCDEQHYEVEFMRMGGTSYGHFCSACHEWTYVTMMFHAPEDKIYEVDLSTLRQTCSACPSQWEGKLTNGSNLYVRYRYGTLRVDIDGQSVFSTDIGDQWDGSITWENVIRYSPLVEKEA